MFVTILAHAVTTRPDLQRQNVALAGELSDLFCILKTTLGPDRQTGGCGGAESRGHDARTCVSWPKENPVTRERNMFVLPVKSTVNRTKWFP